MSSDGGSDEGQANETSYLLRAGYSLSRPRPRLLSRAVRVRNGVQGMSDHSDPGRRPLSEPTPWADLRTALGEGDPQRVRALIEAGADVRYKRDHAYDALLDAVHGRDVARDPRLLELLALLAAHGVDLSGVSVYGESGLRVLSRLGRFDAARLLLDAGADKS